MVTIRALVLVGLLSFALAQGARIAAAQGPAATTIADITLKLESGDPLTFATFGDSITWPCFHTDFSVGTWACSSFRWT